MFEDLDLATPESEGDRRLDGRSRLIISAFFEGAGVTAVASTRDISASGLYMNTSAVLPIGAPVLLHIPLGVTQIAVDARVVYSNPGRGVGVHFSGLSEEVREMMEHADSASRLAT